MKKFFLIVLGIVAVLVVIGLANAPSEAEEAARVEENKAECARMNLVYVRKDPWAKGECVTASEAVTKIIEMQRDQINRGLK